MLKPLHPNFTKTFPSKENEIFERKAGFFQFFCDFDIVLVE